MITRLLAFLLVGTPAASLPVPQGFIDADEPASETVEHAQSEEEAPKAGAETAKSPWYQSLGLGGFVDAGFGVIWPERTNTSFVGEVEIDVNKKLFDVAALRIDVNIQNRLPWQPAGTLPSLAFNNLGLVFDNLVEQAHAEWFPLGEHGPRLRLGKYNANVGYERLDPNERFMASHSLVFLHGAPGNFTGLMFELPLPVGLSLVLHLAVNGFDRGIAPTRNKTFGGKLAFQRSFANNTRLCASFFAIGGTERFANEKDYRITLFAMLAFDIVNRFTLAGETTWGKEPGLARGSFLLDPLLPGAGVVGTANWFGVSAWMRFIVPRVSWLSFAARYDYFNDPARVRGLAQNAADVALGGLTRRQQASLNMSAQIVPGARARLEYSADFIDGREPDMLRQLAVAQRIVMQAIYEF